MDGKISNSEKYYIQACELPHHEVPDFETDPRYYELLGMSARAGYAPAMLKLGECAMRRQVWVEAYYWVWMAKRNGMRDLHAILRDIRINWKRAGSPEEEENAYELFPVEAGSIGRALLGMDSGRDGPAAREFLQANYPDLLKG